MRSEKHLLCASLMRCRDGDRLTLDGEADQIPNQEPGDIVFNLTQIEHKVFRRAGVDLSADIEVTLAESLCGFSRVVITHLDGRGIQIQHPQKIPRVLRPGKVIKLAGEGMPVKKSDSKGDLYLVVRVRFPNDEWLADHETLAKLRELLPVPENPITAEIVDDVTYEEDASLDTFGGDVGDGEAWVDDDDEGEGQPQCAQQ